MVVVVFGRFISLFQLKRHGSDVLNRIEVIYKADEYFVANLCEANLTISSL